MGTGTHIKPDQKRTIVARMKAMPVEQKPTWKAVIAIAQSVTGIVYSRQGLDGVEEIRTALDDKLSAHLRWRDDGIVTKPPAAEEDMDPKDRKILALEAQLKALTDTVRAYDEQLITIIGNAVSGGLTVEQLEKPRAKAPRQRTDMPKQKNGRGSRAASNDTQPNL